MNERSSDSKQNRYIDGDPVPMVLAGRSGALAAAIMLATQIIWRLNWSKNGVVQSFPELVSAAISRLTPLSVFGAATENYGSWAKRSLFLTVLIGVIVIPGLYYVFAKISDGKKLLRDETSAPLTERFEYAAPTGEGGARDTW